MNLKMAVLWDIAPFGLVDIFRRFWGSYCLSNQAMAVEATPLERRSVSIHVNARCNIPEDSHLQIQNILRL
jgi:hypothetical protein